MLALLWYFESCCLHLDSCRLLLAKTKDFSASLLLANLPRVPFTSNPKQQSEQIGPSAIIAAMWMIEYAAAACALERATVDIFFHRRALSICRTFLEIHFPCKSPLGHETRIFQQIFQWVHQWDVSTENTLQVAIFKWKTFWGVLGLKKNSVMSLLVKALMILWF